MDSPLSFQVAVKVVPEDIDEMGHVNNVVYVRWVQDVAAAHWNHIASPELKAKFAWVVLRHEINYLNPGFLRDEISALTWVGEPQGARFDRFVKLTAGSRILAEAKTTWCLLNAVNLRPVRVPQEIISLF